MSKSLAVDKNYYKSLLNIAMPIAIQSTLYTSLGIIDQFMVGQLGEKAIASVGLASKPFGILMFFIFGITGGLAIYASQFSGKGEEEKIAKFQGIAGFYGILITLLFTVAGIVFAENIMSLFIKDKEVIEIGGMFQRIFALGYIPFMITALYSTVLRSTGHIKIPVIASMGAVGLNTLLNYLLIFGNFGFPKMGVEGSAVGTVITRVVEMFVIVYVVYKYKLPGAFSIKKMFSFKISEDIFLKFWKVTIPLIATNVSFALADTVYSGIYGRMGTDQITAITILFPLQGLLIGFFSGMSSAAGIMLGNKLGAGEKEIAYSYSKRFLVLSFGLTSISGIVAYFMSNSYINVFNISFNVKEISYKIMIVMLVFLTVKVLNMVIVQGILSSGGETKFLFYISLIGMWLIGIPSGLIAAFVFKYPIYVVVAIISLEEVVRMSFGLYKIKSKKWLNNLVEKI